MERNAGGRCAKRPVRPPGDRRERCPTPAFLRPMPPVLWLSRLVDAKTQSALNRKRGLRPDPPSDRLGIDGFEAEEALRQDFLCPYCFEDHDITSICAHLEDEHPSEDLVVDCPVCSARIEKELAIHITLKHGNLFKLQRRRELSRTAVTSNQASRSGRDMEEIYLEVLLPGGSSRSGSNIASNAVCDSLLSSLSLNLPTSEAKETLKPSTAEDTCFQKMIPPPRTPKLSPVSSLSLEETERRRKQAAITAPFVQLLLASTLFGDHDDSQQIKDRVIWSSS